MENSVEKVERFRVFNNHVKNKSDAIVRLFCDTVELTIIMLKDVKLSRKWENNAVRSKCD